ncbi:MAG TPA: hypothetical protein VFE78_12945 [Gemmataceae bacterium]|jgi:hypothetical protein|nr:hypothetical protein [Gemmataceae bacterium]
MSGDDRQPPSSPSRRVLEGDTLVVEFARHGYAGLSRPSQAVRGAFSLG